ncbi:MAG: outer membrane lipoprotein carrier protein LolA [Haloplanus sp.]
MRPTFGGWRRFALLVVVLTALVAVAGAATTDGQPSGNAVLNDTRDRYASADSVVATADVTVSNASANRTATVEFAAAGNESRTVVATDDATYRTGVNETVAWYVGPNRTAVWERDALGPTAGVGSAANASAPFAALSNLTADEANVSVEYLRTGSDDGVEAHVVDVIPDRDDAVRTTLWVATTDSRLLRVEIGDGTNTTVVDYRETRFNVSVHESTFDPPSDRLSVTAVERFDTFDAVQANTSLDLPELDATFRNATVITRASGTHVAQQYRADDDDVTVVSTTTDREFNRSAGNVTRVTVNGHAANVTTVGDVTVVYWETEGVTTAVVVEAGQDRAVELARRLDE